jgi:hypothetical protein
MTPPDCSAAVADPSQLWPPNHHFIDVSVTGVTDPDGDAVTITITGITQDETVDCEDNGNPCPDASGVGTSTAHLRAARAGNGDGRVYHVAFLADDGHGGQCTGVVTVCVPHDRGPGRICVDEGALFDSTASTCGMQCNADCDVEMAAASVCTGQKLPRTVQRGVERSRVLLARAAEETDPMKANRLTALAMRSLDTAMRLANHAAKKGKLTADCAHAIGAMVGEASMELGGPTP